MTINQALINKIQAKVDAVTQNTSLNDMLLLAQAAKNISPNISCSVATLSDLPFCGNSEEYPVGSIVNVRSIGTTLVAQIDGWYSFDGRLAKRNAVQSWSWGRNSYGQLGDITTTQRSSPVSVVGGFTWKQVSAGSYHTAAIKSDDTIWAWGYNLNGRLGDNTTTSRRSPVSVVGGFTWKQVSVGFGAHTTAIKSDYTLWAWGSNGYGQLGDNSATSTSSPVSVVGGFTWKQVSAGFYHTAAIKSDDTLWAWGYNFDGYLGDNTKTSRRSPVSVVGGFTWKQVSAGSSLTAAIKSDDTLWAWGQNYAGRLGDGTTVAKSSPVAVVGGFTWKQVSAGTYYTVGTKIS